MNLILNDLKMSVYLKETVHFVQHVHFDKYVYFKVVTSLPALSLPGILPQDYHSNHFQRNNHPPSDGILLSHLKQPSFYSSEDILTQSSDDILLPPSNSLTETDREYYNMIRTEDGSSQYFRDFTAEKCV